jgi:hypothetical protein
MLLFTRVISAASRAEVAGVDEVVLQRRRKHLDQSGHALPVQRRDSGGDGRKAARHIRVEPPHEIVAHDHIAASLALAAAQPQQPARIGLATPLDCVDELAAAGAADV